MAGVKIKVKSPTSSPDDDDKTLTTTLESSVYDLKLKIEADWPSHPRPKDQRLVYAGKLLEDSAVLKEVLRLTDARDVNDAFTVHLVCRLATPAPNVASKQETKASEATAEEFGMRRRPVQPELPTQQNTTEDFGQQGWYNQASHNPDQALMIQHMYASYMNQYMHYLQSIGAVHDWTSSVSNQGIHNHQIPEEARVGNNVQFDYVHAAAAVAGAVAHNNMHDEPAAPNVQPQQQPQQAPNDMGPNMAANGPNVVMNAGAGGIGAMEEDDELGNGGGQRDILDWCYVATRVLVLFSVVYFYSSLARFALAAGLGVIFYLYNNNFFGQNLQQQQRQQQEAAINDVGQVAGANVNNGNNDLPIGAPVGENAPATVVVEQEQQQPHFLNVMATFVTTFFTSLLPQDPQVA